MSAHSVGKWAGKQWARTSAPGKALFVVFLLALIGMALRPSDRTTSPIPLIYNSPASPAPKIELPSPAIWAYSVSTDPMSGAEWRSAMTLANKSLDFAFPYQGLNYPSITVRTSPKKEPEVLLEIMRGQFVCNGCTVTVRFDDQPPFQVLGYRSTDHSSTVLFLGSAQRLISGMRKAKETRFQATFYHEGSPVMNFQTAGLTLK